MQVPVTSMQMSVMNRVAVPVVTGLRVANTACSRRVVRLQAKSEEPAESSSGQDSYSVSLLGRSLHAVQLPVSVCRQLVACVRVLGVPNCVLLSNPASFAADS